MTFTEFMKLNSLLQNCLVFPSLLLILSALTNASDIQKSKESLGQQLFFDPILSLSKTQSCATCHDPNAAFVDKRTNKSLTAGSLGHDGKSLGDRNTPSPAYANQTPAFHINSIGEYIGGMFWDGREADLKGQAGGPPLNPVEMAMPSKAAILERLKVDKKYAESFKKIYGEQIFESAEQVYEAIKESIAAFENTAFFSPFDSKYDRYLSGAYTLSKQEELGMTLFFSQQFTNCSECHLLNKRPLSENETFSDYRYHNIGVPENILLRQLNKSPKGFIDVGLLGNSAVTDEKHRGKFKTPSLRNVAITSPYMHNGVFQELKTVIAFYNQYNSKSPKNKINPETGVSWDKPEVVENIALSHLKKGSVLNEQRIDALVAFLKLLTDKRYE
ncbi:MAG: cytochrome c peroxidase [Oleiphilaceae bacterium]|jgi:cytochrome c peroxidase